MVYMAKAPLER